VFYRCEENISTLSYLIDQTTMKEEGNRVMISVEN
jgi:hypothetical protein